MKIKKSTTLYKKNFLVVLLVFLAVAVTWGTYAYQNSAWPFHNSNDSKAPKKLPKNKQISPSASPSTDKSAQTPANQTPKQYETPSDSSTSHSLPSLSGIINYKSVSGGTLTIRNTIDQRLSNGTCVLQLTNTSTNKIVTKNANIVANPSSSTCMGFDIPTSQLGSGKWNINIMLSSEHQTGEIKDSITL